MLHFRGYPWPLDKGIVKRDNKTMRNKDTSLTEQVRNAVVASGLSQYEFAKRGGFSHRIVGRLLNGTDVQLSTADKMLKVMKLRVELKPIDKE